VGVSPVWLGDDSCRPDCTKCGDGIPDAGEQCDDGNATHMMEDEDITQFTSLPLVFGFTGMLMATSLPKYGHHVVKWCPFGLLMHVVYDHHVVKQ
jgi:hypothetical protein